MNSDLKNIHYYILSVEAIRRQNLAFSLFDKNVFFPLNMAITII